MVVGVVVTTSAALLNVTVVYENAVIVVTPTTVDNAETPVDTQDKTHPTSRVPAVTEKAVIAVAPLDAVNVRVAVGAPEGLVHLYT